ncbi:MAG: EF-hand domain-containing protein [Methylococcales bacterium]
MNTISKVAGPLDLSKPKPINQVFLKYSGLAIALPVSCFSLSLVSAPVNAETVKLPIEKPADGKGKLPSFSEADINGDHYLTKDELKNFPYMLQVFDKVDAGEDGKLEDHEYQNLIMETRREGQVR